MGVKRSEQREGAREGKTRADEMRFESERASERARDFGRPSANVTTTTTTTTSRRNEPDKPKDYEGPLERRTMNCIATIPDTIPHCIDPINMITTIFST